MKLLSLFTLMILTFSSLARADQLPVVVTLPPMWECLDGSWAIDIEDCVESVSVKDRTKIKKDILARGQRVPPRGARIKGQKPIEQSLPSVSRSRGGAHRGSKCVVSNFQDPGGLLHSTYTMSCNSNFGGLSCTCEDSGSGCRISGKGVIATGTQTDDAIPVKPKTPSVTK